jgi:hypothetical protein
MPRSAVLPMTIPELPGTRIGTSLISVWMHSDDAVRVTKTNGQTAAGDQTPALSHSLLPPQFLTNEFLMANELESHVDFCRANCRLCRAFVRRLKTPIEFHSLKPLFPFLRLASVLEFPRTQENLSIWIQLAFQAGRQLGQSHPEAVEEILPDHVLGRSRISLINLERLVGDDGLTPWTFASAFDQLVANQWPEINPVEVDQVYCETAIRALRAGFMAATVAQIDPSLCEFCDDLPRVPLADVGLAHLALTEACVFEWETQLVYRMEHPLLRLARQLHRHDFPAQEKLRARIDSLLSLTGVRSENEDPCCFLNLEENADGENSELDITAYRGRQLEHMLYQLEREISPDLPARP